MRRISRAGVWVLLGLLCIGQFGEQPGKSSSFPVLLNHLVVFVDSDTCGAIKGNTFLNEKFAVCEKRTTVRTDMSYTGFYLYGKSTYIEFMDRATMPGGWLIRSGDLGIGFGVEDAGAIEALRPLTSAGPIETVTRLFKGKQIPWYLSILPKREPLLSCILTWVMQYHPDFLASWHPDSGGDNRGIKQAQILNRYVSVLEGGPDKPLFMDVIGITACAEKKIITDVKNLCLAFGYRYSRDGGILILQGPNLVLRLRESATLRGVQQITLRVNGRPAGKSEYRFGSQSILRFLDERTAVWTF